MPISKLLFSPKDNHLLVNNTLILRAISNINFINSNEYHANHYLPGENFLSLITFLGCSPNINLEPTPDESHCYISLLAPSKQARCLGYTSSCNPKCPSCKKRISDWKTNNWQEPNTICRCDKCATETAYAQLNWKNECGFGCCGFEVTHIYPHEAVPTDQLMEALHEQTGIEWIYSYVNN